MPFVKEPVKEIDRISEAILRHRANVKLPIDRGEAALTQRMRFDRKAAAALCMARELESDFQITNGKWLESVVQRQQDALSKEEVSEESFKEAREKIEDAMDSLEEVSLLDQLGFLNDQKDTDQKDLVRIQAEIVKRLHFHFNDTIILLETLQAQFLEVMKETLACSFQTQVLEFIGRRQDDLTIMKKVYMPTDYFGNVKEVIPVSSLAPVDMKTYVARGLRLMDETKRELEKITSIQRLTPLLKNYRLLDVGSVDLVPKMVFCRNYLAAHLIDHTQKKHAETIGAMATRLTSPLAMKAYADALDMAIQDLGAALLEAGSAKRDFHEQFAFLSECRSPYAKELENLGVADAKERINRYIDTLDFYSDLLSKAIPLCEEQKSKAFFAIKEKICRKKVEAEDLKVSFVARLHFWQLYPEAIKVEDLPSKLLESYFSHIDGTLYRGITELEQDAAAAGFSWG